MAQVNPNSIAAQVKAKNDAKKPYMMTSSEMTQENPNISANARLQQAGIGGAIKKGSYILDNSAKWIVDNNPSGIKTVLPANNWKNWVLGASIATPSLTPWAKSVSNTWVSWSVSPVSSVNTPSVPWTGAKTTTGLPLATSTPGGASAPGTPGSSNIQTPAGLQGQDLQLYNQLSALQKQAFQKVGQDAQKNNEDVVKKQLGYLASVQENKDYLTKSNDITQRVNTLKEDNANIAASQNIAKAQATVDSLKQATSYLGGKGQPARSAVGLDAVSKQIDTAQRLFNQIVSSENNATEARSLGREQDALNFEHQVQSLTTQLHTNVNQAILDAQQKLGNPNITDKIDSPEEMQKLISDVMDNLDGDIAGMTNVHLEQMNYLIDQTSKIQDKLAEQKKNENTVNTDMSEAIWHYVNNNGNSIMWADGKPILFVGKPLYSWVDAESGNFISVTKNPDWTLHTQVVPVAKPKDTSSNWQFNSTTGQYFRTGSNGNIEYSSSPTSTASTSGDFTALTSDLSAFKSQYPNDAWVANNNPAGITYNKNFAQALTDNGIQFVQGGNRWPGEGGNYFKFPTIGEGMKAYNLLWSSPTYQNKTVQQALNTWWTGEVAWLTPEMKNMTVAQLQQSNPEAYKNLQMQQIRKESPGVYNALKNATTAWTDDTNTASKIANYQLDVKDLNALRKDPQHYQQVLNKVRETNPSFSDSDYAANKQTIKDYAPGGKTAQTINNLDTAIKHFGDMSSLVSTLPGHSLGFVNSLQNFGAKQGGADYITKWNTRKTILSQEAAKVISGKQNFPKEDADKFEAMLSPNQSSSQIKANLSAIMEAMSERANTVLSQYQGITGKDPGFLLDKDALKVLQDQWYASDFGISSSSVSTPDWNTDVSKYSQIFGHWPVNPSEGGR